MQTQKMKTKQRKIPDGFLKRQNRHKRKNARFPTICNPRCDPTTASKHFFSSFIYSYFWDQGKKVSMPRLAPLTPCAGVRCAGCGAVCGVVLLASVPLLSLDFCLDGTGRRTVVTSRSWSCSMLHGRHTGPRLCLCCACAVRSSWDIAGSRVEPGSEVERARLGITLRKAPFDTELGSNWGWGLIHVFQYWPIQL